MINLSSINIKIKAQYLVTRIFISIIDKNI